MHLRPGYDWFYPYYRDRALCLDARRDAARDAARRPSARRTTRLAAAGRCRRTGATRAQHRRRRAARPARSACTPSAAPRPALLYERVTDIPDRERSVPRRRGHLRLDRRRRDERRRVLGIAQHRVHAQRCRCSISSRTTATRSRCPVEVQTPGGDISRLVESFPNLKVLRCDGTDFLASYRTMGEAVALDSPRAQGRRSCTPRSSGRTRTRSRTTSGSTRRRTSAQSEAKRDPLTRMRAFLQSRMRPERQPSSTRSPPTSIARSRRRRPRRSPRRSPTPDTADWYVFSPDVDPTSAAFDTPAQPEGKPDTMVAAINRTLKDEMARNPRIVVFGEDVADASTQPVAGRRCRARAACSRSRTACSGVYGSDRVFNSPLAEANIVGRAVGHGDARPQAGRRDPVLRLHLAGDDADPRRDVDAALPLVEQLVSCPMVMRVPIGGYLRGGAPYHSQSGVSIFAHCPGIRIVFPSNADRRRRPAAHVDPLRRSGAVPRAQAPLPPDLQQGRVPGPRLHDPVRQGRARAARAPTSSSSPGARSCSDRCSPRSRRRRTASAPRSFDLRTIIAVRLGRHRRRSCKQTNRVVIAHEDQLTCGFGAEIAARIGDELFEYLDAPVKRVAAHGLPGRLLPRPRRSRSCRSRATCCRRSGSRRSTERRARHDKTRHKAEGTRQESHWSARAVSRCCGPSGSAFCLVPSAFPR